MIFSEIDLFKGLDYVVMNKIAGICDEKSYAKGIVLFRNNEKAEYLYILIEGTVHLEVKNGGTLTYSMNTPGEVFGWSSMFEAGRYTATGICATPLNVFRINSHEMNRIFTVHPTAGLKILRRLGNVFSKRLSDAYHDLLFTRRSGAIGSIWRNDYILPGSEEEPSFDTVGRRPVH